MNTKLPLLLIFAFLTCGVYCKTFSQVPVKKTIAANKHAKKKPSAILQGKSLIANSDCLTCHKLDVKLIGPAYVDVAAKYPKTEANYNLLVQKIITGGSGTWGPVAMSPHPNLAVADARKMVTYILSLK